MPQAAIARFHSRSMDARIGSKDDPVQKVRGIVLHRDGLVLMRRVRKNSRGEEVQYHVFPGGGREVGETLEQCLMREVHEEAGVNVKIDKEFARLVFETKEEIFFICHYRSGKVGSGSGPEFTPERIKQRGLYIAEVVPYDKIADLDLKPFTVKQKLVKELPKLHPVK